MSDSTQEPHTTPPIEVDDRTWQQYMKTMTAWAARALRHAKETTGNFEDVVTSALRTHFRRQQEGLAPPPENTDQLWEILKQCLNSKIAKYRQARRSRKNQSLGQGDLIGDADCLSWEQGFIDDNPTPEHVDDYVQQALEIVHAAVSDPQLHQIARLTLMSYTPAEIGEQLGLSVHQVRRRQDDIRLSLKRLNTEDVS